MMKGKAFAVLLLVLVFAGCSSTQSVTTPATNERTTTTERTSSSSASDSGTASPSEDTAAAGTRIEASRDWFHRDDREQHVPGLSTDRAYRTVLRERTPKRIVTVAIIDSGVDVEHEDLKGQIWTNEDEIGGNGVDDDGNGYVDDVHGWNFIGGSDGTNVNYDTYELTRLYVTLKERFAGVDSAEVVPDDRADYARFQEVKAEFEKKRRETQQRYENVRSAYEAVALAASTLKSHLDTDSLTQETVAAVSSPEQGIQRARDILLYFYQQDLTPKDIREYKDYLQRQVEYNYNPDFNPRSIVGDNYADANERIYGNSDVIGPDAGHGTHVAGIVGAARGNGIGIDGVASNVRLMIIRTVPKGDERDKDVANAIHYAVDNGADIINMSFGKGHSPNKEAVDAAVRYADSLDVLMIHAAGNDGSNVDSTANYPTRQYLDGGAAERWVEVGASSWKPGAGLAAPFSNYGSSTVDVFAPGASIYSTVPDNGYERNDGTSMAAPMVSGLAALIMAYYPELSVLEVRDIILDAATRYPDTEVSVPGGSRMVPFAQLSVTGGIVNAYEALQKAEARTP